jgi:transcriptional regulator with XRE-family HTH domain
MAGVEATNLASELRTRRLNRGMSISTTARQAGITRAYLYRLESGATRSNPSFDVLDRLAWVLGAPSTDELAGRRGRDAPADLLPDALRQYAAEAGLGGGALAPLAALAPFAHPDARGSEWALVHEILAHTILADDVERRHETRRNIGPISANARTHVPEGSKA